MIVPSNALTAAARIAHAQHVDAVRDLNDGRLPESIPESYDDLPPYRQYVLKEALLPIVQAAFDTLPDPDGDPFDALLSGAGS